MQLYIITFMDCLGQERILNIDSGEYSYYTGAPALFASLYEADRARASFATPEAFKIRILAEKEAL